MNISITILVPRGYARAASVYQDAVDHMVCGKGDDRHATRFDGSHIAYVDQQIARNTRICGPGGPALQVLKKTEEALLLHTRGEADKAYDEALGAMNYLAEMAAAIRPADDDEDGGD